MPPDPWNDPHGLGPVCDGKGQLAPAISKLHALLLYHNLPRIQRVSLLRMALGQTGIDDGYAHMLPRPRPQPLIDKHDVSRIIEHMF